jgi:predicted RNA-binding protein with PUA-like domain
MTFLDAARAILRAEGQPMRARDISARALTQGLVQTRGKTPAATMAADLLLASRRPGTGIVKVGRGLWALAEAGGPDAPTEAGASAEARPEASIWLLITNPGIYDVQDLITRGTEEWGGRIRSPVVRKRILTEMRQGDRGLVYRSRPLKQVVCEVEVSSPPRRVGDSARFDVRLLRVLDHPLPLARIRAEPALANLAFLRNTRISISRVSGREYEAIMRLASVPDAPGAGPEATHQQVQFDLITVGKACRCDVWVSPDSRGKSHDGQRLGDLSIRKLPDLGFNERTARLVRGIDVLWLRGTSIVAAFEVEHTTSIYSGLLSLSDLIALQPNVSIELYIVAPAARRGEVVAQVQRPTFDRLERPLRKVCRLLTYEALAGLADTAGRVAGVGYLEMGSVRERSEDCA